MPLASPGGMIWLSLVLAVVLVTPTVVNAQITGGAPGAGTVVSPGAVPGAAISPPASAVTPSPSAVSPQTAPRGSVLLPAPAPTVVTPGLAPGVAPRGSVLTPVVPQSPTAVVPVAPPASVVTPSVTPPAVVTPGLPPTVTTPSGISTPNVIPRAFPPATNAVPGTIPGTTAPGVTSSDDFRFPRPTPPASGIVSGATSGTTTTPGVNAPSASPGTTVIPGDLTSNLVPTMPFFGPSTPFGPFVRWVWVPSRRVSLAPGLIVDEPGFLAAETTIGVFFPEHWVASLNAQGTGFVWQLAQGAFQTR